MNLYQTKKMPERDRIYVLSINDIDRYQIRIVNNFKDLGLLREDKLEHVSNLYELTIDRDKNDEFNEYNSGDTPYTIINSKIPNNHVNKITLVKYVENGVFEELSSGVKIGISLTNLYNIEDEYSDIYSQEEAKSVENKYVDSIYSDTTEGIYNKAKKLLDIPLVVDYKESGIYIAEEDMIKSFKEMDTTNLKEYMLELNNVARKSLEEEIYLIPKQDEYFAHVENNLKKKL